MAFQTGVDIGNLALQFLGLPRINTTLGFTENSQRAQEISAAYGKLKRAELRRTVFQWAIRRTVLRPLDTNTMIIQPALWEGAATYFRGSIVSDETGFFWISKIPNNTGNIPQNFPTYWEPYFGPLTVGLYNSTLAYYAGELVYTAPGDGTYLVYQSQMNVNGLDPSLPNVWSSAATYFKNMVVVVYPSWAVGTTYAAGATVSYTDGNYYTSLVGANVGNTPPSSPTDWALLPVLQLMPTANAPTPAIGVPLGNLPQTSPVLEWNPTQTYSTGSFVMWNAVEYVSTTNNNVGNNPATSGDWAALTGGTSYMSLVDLNTNYPPASSASQWTATFTGGVGNQQWLLIGGTNAPANGVALSTIDLVYPLGVGPSTEASSRNIFRLPAGFLREAPQDPKAGSTSWLGAPSGQWYNDWTKWGNYIVSQQSDPIVYTFVADVADVSTADDMWCAGMAYRVALATVTILTESQATKQSIAQEYQKFMGEARIVGGIDTGPTEPPEDDYVIARL